MPEKLPKCICNSCGKYWPSEAAKKRHEKCHKKHKKTEDTDDISYSFEVTDEFCKLQDDNVQGNVDRIQVVENIKDFMASPFEIINGEIEDDIF